MSSIRIIYLGILFLSYGSAAEKSDHWAFQRPVKSAPPETVNEAWNQKVIDRFVLHQIEARGLVPNSMAAPRTLIRRLFFDLVGLPPEPAEIDTFVTAAGSDRDLAVQQLVDRLLDSPQFGERWARHWLDVARFAESSGHERNFTYPHAWRYRDWVIDSFNADKPWDRFIREQIAGDLMPFETREQQIDQTLGTAFLAIGPKNHLTGDKDNLDLIDDQIDVMSKSVLGLTVACARCHDHMYDPVSTADYYSLAGIFASTESMHGTIKGKGGGNNRLYSDLWVVKGDAAKAKALTKQREAKLLTEEKKLDQCRKALVKIPRENPTEEQTRKIEALRKQKSDAEAAIAKLKAEPKPNVEFAMAVREGKKPLDMAIRIKGVPGQKGDVVPRGFPVVLTDPNEPVTIPTEKSGRLELAAWLTSESNPLTARVVVNRVWQHLFGQGIVTTVDNFGMLGAPPSHPELLDYLAVEFVEKHRWSVKSLIREIVTSQVYQLSSDFNESNYQLDPDNTSLWRMRPRRLEFEPMRDAILSFSGELDSSRPQRGSVVAEMGDGCLERQIKTAPLSEDRNWRSIYLSVVRFYAPEMAEAFDCAPSTLSTGRRAVTSVPGQALFMLNNEFITRQANHAAGRILADKRIDNRTRITKAFERALGRKPDAGELKASLQFISEFPTKDPTEAWAAFAQSLFTTAEFRYVY